MYIDRDGNIFILSYLLRGRRQLIFVTLNGKVAVNSGPPPPPLPLNGNQR